MNNSDEASQSNFELLNRLFKRTKLTKKNDDQSNSSEELDSVSVESNESDGAFESVRLEDDDSSVKDATKNECERDSHESFCLINSDENDSKFLLKTKENDCSNTKLFHKIKSGD